jgi:hypothetical protein
MADNFYLDEPAFEGVTDSMLVTGTNLGTDYDNLNGVLLATQGCWGDDEIGKAFEGNYWEDAEDIRVKLAPAGEGLVTSAKGVRGKARDLASLDEENARWLDSQVEEE